MKRKRIKKKFKIFFIILLFIVILLLFTFNDEKSIKKDKVVDYLKLVYDKINDYGIDKDFLYWMDKEYDSSIKKLYTLLNEKEFDKSLFHDVTGYSYIVLNDLYNKKYDNMDNVKIVKSNDISTLSFVGDVSLADNWYIAPKYDERGKGVKGILSDEILNIMTESELMVVNSEFTVSNRGSSIPGKMYTFRAKPERLNIYHEMGVDLAALANNHVYDFGKDAFLDMLDSFEKYDIPYIGAGHNIDEAKKPYYFIVNGYKIALVNATRAEKNIMTPGATDESEGVFRCYDPTEMINLIKDIRNDTDYIITIIHFGTEYSHKLEDVQISSARQYIDAGADAIVGHHAHVLQGVEIYKDKPIIYNLGNFIFNEETTDTAIFSIKLDNDGTMDYYIVPALQKDCYTDILLESEKQRVIENMNSWSINAHIDEDGMINW